MAIQSNASTEEVTGGGKEFFSGLTNVSVLAVNPTMAELHALDINVKQEPAYSGTSNDQEWNKVTFWLNNEDGNFKLDLFLKNSHKLSQTGKHLWLNNVGQSTWSEDAPTYDWWKVEGQRKAYDGERELIEFTKAWANVAAGGSVFYDTMSAIAAGDVTEVKNLAAALKSNQLRVLIGVKDSQYQGVYTGYFGRVKPQRDDMFVKNLNDEYSQFKNHDFNADLKWGKHISTASLVTPDTIDENADWTVPADPQANAPF
jgi:hypothetical protein|tara:strand:+ start:386 stop:1159 length:774 start_codon:yes stop_codon:yes gene_type:complete